ncbi:MAG TPA: hypothetical protein VGE52_05560 [Pirellulales bacterium]
MSPESLERLNPLFIDLASALIEATPEWWTEALLRVKAVRTPEEQALPTKKTHKISSREFLKDIVVATDDVVAASRAIQADCDAAGELWSELEFRVEQSGGEWTFHAAFQYPE